MVLRKGSYMRQFRRSQALREIARRSAIHRSNTTVDPNLTRDEIILRALSDLRLIRARRSGPHQYSRSELRDMLLQVASYRAAAITRPKVSPEGRAFYVSIRNGERFGLLYGPLPTQLDALKALPAVRQMALKVSRDDAVFSAFGTASLPIEEARHGLLNHYLAAEA